MNPLDRLQYSVVDVETTGLFPQYHDRVVEVAVLRLDASGCPIDEFTSLVNPKRRVGPSHIHGISQDEVADAPVFEEIAGDVFSRLTGAVLVAHNVHFDHRFLIREAERAQIQLPRIPLLCTMKLSRETIPDLPGRRLEVCCAHVGIRLANHHCAVEDARAVAGLLRECLRRRREAGAYRLRDIGLQCYPEQPGTWPALQCSGKCKKRMLAPVVRAEPLGFIPRLIMKLPCTSAAECNLDPYLAVLDRVLEDELLTEQETELLLDTAKQLGLSRIDALRAHEIYVGNLVRVALADGVITDSEWEQLNRVGALLSVSSTRLKRLAAAR